MKQATEVQGVGGQTWNTHTWLPFDQGAVGKEKPDPSTLARQSKKWEIVNVAAVAIQETNEERGLGK